MDSRDTLKHHVINSLKHVRANNCMETIQKNFTITGVIPHTYWGSDIYGMKATKPDESVNYLNVKKLNTIPDFIMKVAYQSDINVKEAILFKKTCDLLYGRTPHITLYYKHLLCDNTRFRGYRKAGIRKSSENNEHVKVGKSVITLMEYSGKSMYTFFKMYNNARQQYNFIVQLLYTIHLFQIHNITHGDLMFSNITFMKLDKAKQNQIWTYKIGDAFYRVKIGAYIPIIIDFGEGTMNMSPVVYNQKYNTSDPWTLLEQWSFHTHNDQVKQRVERILQNMTTTVNNESRIVNKYLWARNIMRDFFKEYHVKSTNVNHSSVVLFNDKNLRNKHHVTGNKIKLN